MINFVVCVFWTGLDVHFLFFTVAPAVEKTDLTSLWLVDNRKGVTVMISDF